MCVCGFSFLVCRFCYAENRAPSTGCGSMECRPPKHSRLGVYWFALLFPPWLSTPLPLPPSPSPQSPPPRTVLPESVGDVASRWELTISYPPKERFKAGGPACVWFCFFVSPTLAPLQTLGLTHVETVNRGVVCRVRNPSPPPPHVAHDVSSRSARQRKSTCVTEVVVVVDMEKRGSFCTNVVVVRG